MYHDLTTLMDHLIAVKQYVNSSFSLFRPSLPPILPYLLPNTYFTSFAVTK